MDDMSAQEGLDRIKEIAERLEICPLKSILFVILGSFSCDQQGADALLKLMIAHAMSEINRLNGTEAA